MWQQKPVELILRSGPRRSGVLAKLPIWRRQAVSRALVLSGLQHLIALISGGGLTGCEAWKGIGQCTKTHRHVKHNLFLMGCFTDASQEHLDFRPYPVLSSHATEQSLRLDVDRRPEES